MGREPSIEALLAKVDDWDQLPASDQERLREIAWQLTAKDLPASLVIAGLRSTANVLRELRDEETRPDHPLQRDAVRRFISENAVATGSQVTHPPRREHKREERERLHAYAWRLLREARQARGRHEVKKTRNLLLKLDQRELRRVLGSEGDDLCRQINTWLRSTANLF